MTARDEAPVRVTLRGVEAFVAVIEAGALNGAAARLGASTSTVSQQITNLEAALGARLVDRTARPVVATAAGRLFLRRARRVLDELSRGRAELAASGLAELAALNFAVIEELDADVTPALMTALQETLPSCRMACRSGPSHANVAALTARRVDIAVAGEIEAVPEGLEYHPLMRDPYVLVTVRGLAEGAGDPLEVLRGAPFVGFDDSHIMHRQIAAQFRRSRFDVTPSVAFETNHAALAMVVMNRGWTITTPLGFRSVPRFHDRLEMLPLPVPGFARTLALYAYREALGDLPRRAAAILREALARDMIAPMLAAAPWLEGAMHVVGEGAVEARSGLQSAG